MSKGMVTLCFPVNRKGSTAYNSAMKVLDPVRICSKKSSEVSVEERTKAIDRAIEIIKIRQKKVDSYDTVKEDTLLALLYFSKQDFRRAYYYSSLIFKYSHFDNNGLAHYIRAVSGLYVGKQTYESLISESLKPALMESKDNPFIPLMLKIFIDKTLLVMTQSGRFSWDEPQALIDLLDEEVQLESWRPGVAASMLGVYVWKAEDLDARIKSLESAKNPLISNSRQVAVRIAELRRVYLDVLALVKNLACQVSRDKKISDKEDVSIFLKRIDQLAGVAEQGCGVLQDDSGAV
jgi:hypothetical protein